jgi:CheY-like chemotaxis protein
MQRDPGRRATHENFLRKTLMPTNILVVDDSAIDRRRVEHLLETKMSDVEVTLAINGGMALDYLVENVPDLIVSDMRMPQMNGLEFVKALGKASCKVPVILMTSHGSEEIAVQALRAGASGYVPKRRLESDLVKTVNDLLVLSHKREDHRRVLKTISAVEYVFNIDTDPTLVTPVVTYLLHQMRLMNLGNSVLQTRIGVALQEALSNAMLHGNLELDAELRQNDEQSYYELAEERRRQSFYADRKIKVSARLSPQEARFTVTDDGPGFDVAKFTRPESEPNLDRIGDRGLLLIRSFMDHVIHNCAGNEITMAIRISSPEVEAPLTISVQPESTVSERKSSLVV